MNRRYVYGIVLFCAAGCANSGNRHGGPNPEKVSEGSQGPAFSPSPLQRRLAQMTPQKARPASDQQRSLAARLDAHFQNTATRRFYVHTDKPLYQPGETVWFRIWELDTPTLMAGTAGHGVLAELISPKGASVLNKRIQNVSGLATNDFVIPGTVQGGEYKLRVTSDRGGMVERPIVVSTYQPPQIKKRLEFLRKAYGAGDRVKASLELNRGTGEPLAAHSVRAIASVDGTELKRFSVQTNAGGKAVVAFELPQQIARGDGLLTILVDDAGITESIQKRIPITVRDLSVSMFPEGGDLVEGLPTRVYFAAKNPLGKPADVAGRVVDDRGLLVTHVKTLHNGMGRFELTPAPGRSYRLEINKPAGIAKTFELPAAHAEGCSMQSIDDFDDARDDVRVALWCTDARTVVGVAALREKRLGEVAVDVVPGIPSVLSLPVVSGNQGAVRVTIFDEALQPLAERLVYKNRGRDLKISMKPKKERYTPREKVELEIEARDPAGNPVVADLALAVVDDTVLSFADDKTAGLLARLYLESEMPGQKIEEPNFYFGEDAKASRALDMVLATQGWRRFDWQFLTSPRPEPTTVAAKTEAIEGKFDRRRPLPPPMPRDRGRKMPAAKKAPPAPAMAKRQVLAQEKEIAAAPMARVQAEEAMAVAEPIGGIIGGGLRGAAADAAWAGEADDELAWQWAPVRQFPAPNYQNANEYDGPRTDFRETILWQAQVRTDDDGKGLASFYLSDAVTSFRAIAEGVSAGGTPGRGEALIQSKLPVSLAVKMPNEVSAGDSVKLPITLINETSRRRVVDLQAEFGNAFKVRQGIPKRVELAAGERESYLVELAVVGDGSDPKDGAAMVRLDTQNLKDEVSKEIRVVPLGFPQEVSFSGTLADRKSHELDLAGIIPGSINASVTLYPSPVTSMMKGMEAIIREPHGCFEQTSSANYPNIMVLSYLEEYDGADAELVAKAAGMLDRGYKKLVGYESKSKGFEWFGQDPGHEALSAYGLMEFADMKAVYPDVDDTMVKRTRAWLRSRRDGKGGYKRNSQALDSFGSASPEVTDAYITFALTEAGERDLKEELMKQGSVAMNAKDPYLVALATNTMLNAESYQPSKASGVGLRRLAAMQSDDGAFKGADHSITRSGGQALDIETTSLALLAFLKGGDDYMAPATKAAKWLNTQRNGFGGYGSTQSTILALRSLTAYTKASRRTRSSGTAKLRVNGKIAGTLRYEKGHDGELVFEDIGGLLHRGKNAIELELDSASPLPYSVSVEYRTQTPPSSSEAVARVKTSLAKKRVPMGEGVRLNVVVSNTTDKGQPMTVARIGIPGGTRFQTWQLKELRDKGIIGFYETQAREVVLYFRDLAPKAEISVPIELIAEVPGTYVAPASRAYLYYTAEHKHWQHPERLEVVR